MENSFTHNLVNMGGGIMSPGPDSTLCVAFAAAVAEFCGPPPAPNRDGRFNDMLYNHLESTHPPEGLMLAEQMKREVATLADRNTTRTLREMYKQAKREGNPSRIQRYGRALRGENVLRSRLGRGEITHNQYRRLSNNNLSQSGLGARQFRYPDGMLNGYPVEFKSPNDKWGNKVSNKSGGDQKADYQKIREDGQVIEVSCESCNHPCAGKGFKC
ncbi:hypothetical protein BE04_24730 [Sorangium cellulosum]|uniref:Uncharacterized protein n=1 Tax=Sorangium cellulosum TaxID=56 RepID=A0A150P2P8_SORCE|nr:hypothetical protein BE04_24730 [Sorangium cellulosum]